MNTFQSKNILTNFLLYSDFLLSSYASYNGHNDFFFICKYSYEHNMKILPFHLEVSANSMFCLHLNTMSY